MINKPKGGANKHVLWHVWINFGMAFPVTWNGRENGPVLSKEG